GGGVAQPGEAVAPYDREPLAVGGFHAERRVAGVEHPDAGQGVAGILGGQLREDREVAGQVQDHRTPSFRENAGAAPTGNGGAKPAAVWKWKPGEQQLAQRRSRVSQTDRRPVKGGGEKVRPARPQAPRPQSPPRR